MNIIETENVPPRTFSFFINQFPLNRMNSANKTFKYFDLMIIINKHRKVRLAVSTKIVIGFKTSFLIFMAINAFNNFAAMTFSFHMIHPMSIYQTNMEKFVKLTHIDCEFHLLITNFSDKITFFSFLISILNNINNILSRMNFHFSYIINLRWKTC